MNAPKPRGVLSFTRRAGWIAACAIGALACDRIKAGDELPTGAVAVPSTPSTTLPAAPSIRPTDLTPPLVQNQAAPLSFAPIARKADPGVVTINTVGEEVEAPSFFSRGKCSTR